MARLPIKYLFVGIVARVRPMEICPMDHSAAMRSLRHRLLDCLLLISLLAMGLLVFASVVLPW